MLIINSNIKYVELSEGHPKGGLCPFNLGRKDTFMIDGREFHTNGHSMLYIKQLEDGTIDYYILEA